MTKDREILAAHFDEHRARLRNVAARMLGSTAEAEDAVQEAWLRLSQGAADEVVNLGAWLTTVVARVCLDVLKARRVRTAPETIEAMRASTVEADDGRADPSPEAQLAAADAVGVALSGVLEALPPDERLAFVLHDIFEVPFVEIAEVIGSTPPAARQLASRGRRRLTAAQGRATEERRAARSVVDAFLAAARGGSLGALVSVLHPDVVLRTDLRAPNGDLVVVQGAETVARRAMFFARAAAVTQPVLVSGEVSVLSFTAEGAVLSLMTFGVEGGRVVEIRAVADPERLGALDLRGVRPSSSPAAVPGG